MRKTGQFNLSLAFVAVMVLSACATRAPSPVATTPAPVVREEPAHATPHWSYGTEYGPADWATLSSEFAICGSGKTQSPVDISRARTAALDEFEARYSPASLKVVRNEYVADGINNGHTVQVNCEGIDTLTLGNEAYRIVQYHFHSPSENTVDGNHFPMEMHLVHRSSRGSLAVIGVFIEEGAENPAFAPVWANLPREKGQEFHLEHVTVNVDDLLPKERTTWRFDGSLTTPPCTEGVKWFVMTQPVQLSAQQIATFRKIIHDNNRPTQPLNGRRIVTDRIAEP